MAAFAKLSEGHRERLEVLIEECAEIVQIGTKILRHGQDSYHPDDQKKTPNVRFLEQELLDLLCVVVVMTNEGDIQDQWSNSDLGKRWQEKKKWMHHQRQ